MKTAIICGIVILAIFLPGCSANTLKVTTPDGTVVEGSSIVFNNSEEVVLSGKGDGWEFSFTKVGTDGTPQAEIVSDAVGTVAGALVP